MARLSFLRRCLPAALRGFPGNYCLVDYGCPEASGDWLEATYPEQVANGRMVVHRVSDVRQFHKTDALNQGARRALAGGARYLCFLDADTLVRDGFWGWLEECWDPARFLVAAPDCARSAFGVLVVAAQDFRQSGGYDESFRGWGNEDLELRLRLHLQAGLAYDFIPARFLSAIAHGDELRTHLYPEKDIHKSFNDSWSYTMNKVRAWTGSPAYELGPSVTALLRPLQAADATEDGAPPSVDAAARPRAARRGWRRWGGR